MTIEVEEVCFSSQGKKILKDITWEVSSDDLWLLSGESGSGKTALLSIIIGTLKPDSGKVRLLGDYKYSRVNAGVCFQDDRLFKNMTAAENVAVVTNVIPNTGISLPFISYGGSSAVFLMTEMGLVQRVARESEL